MSKKSLSLCILRLTALGDCINAFGMICAIKNKAPSVALTWVIDKRFAPLFRDAQGKDLVPMLPVDFSNGTLSSLKFVYQKLKGCHFDALLNLQTSLKSSLCSLAIKAQKKYGYDKERSREGQCLFVNHKVPSPANPHVLAGFMAFAREAGFGDLSPRWDFRLSEEEQRPFMELGNKEKLFVIAPASAKPQKNWNAQGYAAIAEHAVAQGFHVILAGSKSPTELSLCQDICSLCHVPISNLCGQTSLRSLAALLQCAALVLSPDSAAMHLASALGTPVISLFAVHNPKRVGSWRYPDLWVSVYHQLAQKEYGRKRHLPWRYRVRDTQAMSHISFDMVKNAFDLALEHYLPKEDF